MSSIEDCCSRGVPPFGMSYVVLEDESCNPCPVGKLISRSIAQHFASSGGVCNTASVCVVWNEFF